MESILDWLFASELTVQMSEQEERRYARESEEVTVAAEKLAARLPPELQGAWSDYKNRRERLHDWERQNEFERGFCMAFRLMLELTGKELV